MTVDSVVFYMIHHIKLTPEPGNRKDQEQTIIETH